MRPRTGTALFSAGRGGNASGSGGSAGNSGGSVGSTGGTPNVGPVLDAGDPGTADVAFDVHADREVRPISPLIYGTNGAPDIARNHQNAARIVLVAINKSTATKSAGIRITHSVQYGTAKVWTLAPGQAELVSAASLTATATNAFRYEMPAQSVSVIVPEP